MTKTGLEFVILVIVICLIFVIWYLEFVVIHYSMDNYNLNHMRSSATTISPEYSWRQAATTSVSSQAG